MPLSQTAPLSQSRAILRDLLLVAAVGASIWVAHRLGRIVLVLILAMFFAYVIAPLVELVSVKNRYPATPPMTAPTNVAAISLELFISPPPH